MAEKKNKPKKVKPPEGKYVSRKDAAQLKQAQTKRSVFMFSSTLTLALMLFVPQEWADKAKDLIWLQSLYVLLIAALIVISVITSYGALRGCNLTGEISERYKPRQGFEKRTFASFEFFMYLHFLLAAAQIALVVYGFGIWGLINAVLAAAGAVLAYLARDISFKTLKDDVDYLPPITAHSVGDGSNIITNGGDGNGTDDGNGGDSSGTDDGNGSTNGGDGNGGGSNDGGSNDGNGITNDGNGI